MSSPFAHLAQFVVIPAALSASCAGPSTPLGAIDWGSLFQTSSDPGSTRSASNEDSDIKILFQPERQVLHQQKPWVIRILDPSIRPHQESPQIRVFYNNQEVTQNFLSAVKIETSTYHGNYRIEVPAVYLDTHMDHSIRLHYLSADQKVTLEKDFLPPQCHAFREESVHSTSPFAVSHQLLRKIQEESLKRGISPALFTGLIAQESSFDPQTVSWAKAIGLTQMTSAAESDIIANFPQFPRFPELDSFTTPWIKGLISSGKLNAKNEWRLDPQLSVQGGLAYLHALAEKWSSAEKLEFLKKNFDDPELEHSRLVLASYNSGFTRVTQALQNNGKDWLKSPQLKEARHYINRIFSYCYHFKSET